MPPKNRKPVDVCAFCGTNDDSEVSVGPLEQTEGLQAHLFCTLLSSGLLQRGKDDEGIQGFLKVDILKELRRAAKLKCSYCKKPGASVGCAEKKCSRRFHLNCGRENGVLAQFFKGFSSFCQDHRPHQRVPPGQRDVEVVECCMCSQHVRAEPSDTTLQASCCKTGWFHTACVQKYAMSAGVHFMKCPLCKNAEVFQNTCLKFGIYIPSRDASWEVEPGAYSELLERPTTCAVDTCRCPRGRRHTGDTGRWELLFCEACGHVAAHLYCAGRETWTCSDCAAVLTSPLKRTPSSLHAKRARLSASPQPTAEAEDTDEATAGTSALPSTPSLSPDPSSSTPHPVSHSPPHLPPPPSSPHIPQPPLAPHSPASPATPEDESVPVIVAAYSTASTAHGGDVEVVGIEGGAEVRMAMPNFKHDCPKCRRMSVLCNATIDLTEDEDGMEVIDLTL